MKQTRLYLFLFALLLVAACTTPQAVVQETQPVEKPSEEVVESTLPKFSAVEAGIFDNGRMWTFEYPPIEYFSETYSFDPNEAWFERARLGSVRLPNCSGSFVSSNGLVMTNHHCVREEISQISLPGEELLDNGFYAVNLSDERKIEDYYVDQLVSFRDVTDLILDQVDAFPLEEQAAVRAEIIAAIQNELQAEVTDENVLVDVVSLYNGGRYTAYYFRRYDDIRMVMAPELQIGYYGGDADNFTYPRYNLDMSFFRVYENDAPMKTPDFFPFSKTGVEEGDAVFLIGNPGSTTRQQTVSQLTYRGIYGDKYRHNFFVRTIEGLDAYYAHDPVEAEAMDLRNYIFGLKNAEKYYGGQVEALQNDELMGRRVFNEQRFKEQIASDPELTAIYMPLFDEIEQIQNDKVAWSKVNYPALGMSPGSRLTSAISQRALYAYVYAYYIEMGVPAEELVGLRASVEGIADKPAFLDEMLLKSQINLFVDILGNDHDIVEAMLDGHTPEALASEIAKNSQLATSANIGAVLDGNVIESTDPALQYISSFAPFVLEAQENYRGLMARETELLTQLGRAWYVVFGTSIPPDATFSLRISDGVVSGYSYNGTVAPAYTTFYGLYDRARSHHSDAQWALPSRWQKPSVTLDLGTPVNFVSTNDIIGGNSGSPVVNVRLEVVGLAFDSNIEGMGSADFILDSMRSRAVSVDSRGMLEALKHVYKADRLVRELSN